MTGLIHTTVSDSIAGWNETDAASRRMLDGPDARHDRVRFTWHLHGPTARSPSAPTSPPWPTTRACATSRDS